jgi:hypothetical protein
MPTAQRIALALQLGDDDLRRFCAIHNLSRSAALVRLCQARGVGRRPSVANRLTS